MKKLLVFLCAIAFIFSITATANALILYTDRTEWESAVVVFEDVDIAGQLADFGYLASGDMLDLPYDETIYFDKIVQKFTVPNGWSTWSDDKTPAILVPQEEGFWVDDVTGYFDHPVAAFGLEMEPNDYDEFYMDLLLSTGEMLSQPVVGYAGASFFGWSHGSVVSMTLRVQQGATGDMPDGFAFGEMVKGAPVSEPATMLLLGSGLIGLGFLGRKKLFKK